MKSSLLLLLFLFPILLFGQLQVKPMDDSTFVRVNKKCIDDLLDTNRIFLHIKFIETGDSSTENLAYVPFSIHYKSDYYEFFHSNLDGKNFIQVWRDASYIKINYLAIDFKKDIQFNQSGVYEYLVQMDKVKNTAELIFQGHYNPDFQQAVKLIKEFTCFETFKEPEIIDPIQIPCYQLPDSTIRPYTKDQQYKGKVLFKAQIDTHNLILHDYELLFAKLYSKTNEKDSIEIRLDKKSGKVSYLEQLLPKLIQHLSYIQLSPTGAKNCYTGYFSIPLWIE
jgi:hypothetical protein